MAPIERLSPTHDLCERGYKYTFEFNGETHYSKTRRHAEEWLEALIADARRLGFKDVHKPDAWDGFLRTFRTVNQLDPVRKSAAEVILKECQEQAQTTLGKLKKRLDANEDPAKREALLEPVKRIFDETLITRLSGLLEEVRDEA